jgi:hypothetical protein
MVWNIMQHGFIVRNSTQSMEERTMARTLQKWITLVVLTALIAALPAIASAALAKSAVGGHTYLELDGMPMGPLTSFEGGLPFAELVALSVGANAEQQKRIGPVKYADITLTFGNGMAKPLYQWLQDTLAKKTYPKNGAIVFVDQNYNEIKRLVFGNALIKEITLPALAANEGKTNFFFTLRFSPEFTRPEPGKGGKVAQGFGAQKQLSVANYRLTMPGIDGQWVTKIELPSLKPKIDTERYGQQRIPTNTIAAMEFSNVVIEMPDNHAQGLGDWVNDFLVKGNNGQGKEKSATIELLDPSLKTILMTINLTNLGVLKLEASKVEANKDAARTIRASMYCQAMQFSFSGK